MLISEKCLLLGWENDSYVLLLWVDTGSVSQNQYVVIWCHNASYFNIHAHLHIICIYNLHI